MWFLRSDPLKKLQKKYAQLMEQARDIQRSGDIKGYAAKIDEAESVAVQIRELEAGTS